MQGTPLPSPSKRRWDQHPPTVSLWRWSWEEDGSLGQPDRFCSAWDPVRGDKDASSYSFHVEEAGPGRQLKEPPARLVWSLTER